MAERPRLDSWKEIARHLGRDVRTVIRWERYRGLPIYRVPGGRLPRVFAYPDELDHWLTNGVGPEPADEAEPAPDDAEAPPPPPNAVPSASDAPFRRPWLLLGIGLVAGIGMTAAIWGWTRAGGPIASLTAGRNEVVALDASGRRLWAHQFDASTTIPQLLRWNWIGDLDDDGREEALTAVQIRRAPSSEFFAELSRFSPNGAQDWSVTLDDRLAFREETFGPPWVAADLSTYRVQGERRIAWTVHHFTWWPGVLVTLDARGNRLATFVNSGWIGGVEPSPDERHLLAGGVTNRRGAYFFAVLDAAHPGGRSPEPPGTPTECRNCPEGHPLQYVVFPRTDVSQHQPFPTAGPTMLTNPSGAIRVHVLSSGGPNIADTIYEFVPSAGPGTSVPYRLDSVSFSDSYWEWHQRLEQEGRIDHAAAACPERDGIELQQWTPDGGWTSMRVDPR